LVCGLAVGLYVAFNFLLIPDSIYALAAILILLTLFFFDLLYFTLPDQVILPSIVGFGIIDLYRADSVWFFGVGLLIAIFFAILYAGSRGKGLGFGDVKLGLLIGLMLGYPFGATSVIMGVWAAALVGLGLVITGKATRKDALPLGSFLTAAAIISLIFSYDLPFIRLFR
jgi:leader peptidase (prepilin peptidase)/N-methyltransferase